MSASANSRQPISTYSLDSVNTSSMGSPPAIGAELVFTQDISGCYLSFYWQKAEDQSLQPEKIVGQSLNETFGPVESATYLRRVQRILESLVPERCQYVFRCRQQLFEFELVISPILPAKGCPTSVLVMGRMLEEVQIDAAVLQTAARTHQETN